MSSYYKKAIDALEDLNVGNNKISILKDFARTLMKRER